MLQKSQKKIPKSDLAFVMFLEIIENEIGKIPPESGNSDPHYKKVLELLQLAETKADNMTARFLKSTAYLQIIEKYLDIPKFTQKSSNHTLLMNITEKMDYHRNQAEDAINKKFEIRRRYRR